MQEPKKQVSEPLVLHIRISGRWMPMLSAISVFALLPALSASAPLEEGAPLALSAKAARAQGVDLGTAAAMTVSTSAARLTDAAQASAGGGAIAFPGISLPLAPGTPGATGVVAASPFVRAPGFILPVVGPLTSVFGPRQHPVLGVPMFHTGIDLSAACGTPVRAAADGTVAYAGVTPSWGQRIIIEHDTQLKTGYAHLSRIVAREGQAVRQGDVIGLVGTTGWSTGCHLHFDVILNERYVDPRPYLGLGPAASVSIPYTAAPHRVTDTRGSVVYTVEDGDVPIPVEVTSPAAQPPATSTPTTSTPTTTTAPPTTDPTTTAPPTTAPPTTTDPTTTTPPPTTSDPTTDPTTTTPPPTTSDPTTAPTTDPTTAPTDATTTSAPPATTDPTTATTSEPAPMTTSEPAAAPTSEPTSAPTTSTAAAETTTTTSTDAGSTSAPAADTTATDAATTPAS